MEPRNREQLTIESLTAYKSLLGRYEEQLKEPNHDSRLTHICELLRTIINLAEQKVLTGDPSMRAEFDALTDSLHEELDAIHRDVDQEDEIGRMMDNHLNSSRK